MKTETNPLANLPSQYQKFFDVARKQRRGENYDHVYFGSLDAEWYRGQAGNILLSYQIAACSRHQAINKLFLVREGQRPELAEIVEKLIGSVNGGVIPVDHHRKKILVCIACHNTVAEYSILDDRDKPSIVEAITLLRKTTVTLLDPIEITLPGYCQVHVRLYDTMLLAPATHRSLKKLSTLLGSESELKESITQYHIEHMNVYLREDPVRFERYALKDTEVTLKLFFLLQESLNQLAFKKVRQLFITLGSAAVASFVKDNRWHKEYLRGIRSAKFADAIRLMKRGYFGGRNEGFLRGRTSRYECTKAKTWVDIDMKGAYPTVMSRIPRIDLNGEIRLLQTSFLLDDQRIALLKDNNVPLSLIKQAQSALKISPWQFEQTLFEIKREIKGTVSARIREAALVYDSTLIDEWYAAWTKTKIHPGSDLEQCIVPGLARVKFSFPPNQLLYPCQHVHHPAYGLIYPLAGETVATHIEIMLALDAGAKIDAICSLELPVQRDENGQPVLYMQEHMARLAAKRKRYKDMNTDENPSAPVFEKLLKEFMNSLYGKFAQGVNPRKSCNIATFEMDRLGPSKISDPVVAALTTGTARAVLSSILLSIEKYNFGKPNEEWIAVASCTTDGLLVGLPSSADYSVLGTYYQRKEAIYEGENLHCN